MNTSAYLSARDFTEHIGQPVMILILLLAIVVVICAGIPQFRKYSRLAVFALFLAFVSGWLLLATFHYRIATTLTLVDPTGQLPPGSFHIPVWIENEKLYFWAMIVGLLTVIGRHRPKVFQSTLNLIFAAFAGLVFFTSNPFARPLPDFHEGFMRYVQAVVGGQDIRIQAQAYYAMYGKLVGFYNTPYMWIHPPMLFIAYSLFVLAFIGCIFMLVKRDASYDKLAYFWSRAGFTILTVGLLIGYPWALQAWKGEPWWYDPKINVTLMMWLLYCAYFHARLYIHRRGMWATTAVLGYLAFLGVVITYVTTYVIPGIHSVAG